MSKLVNWLDKKLYPEHSDNWDDELFRKLIMSYIRPEHSMLDLGAGAGIVSQMNFKGLSEKVCGVDPDVLEHIDSPDDVLSEIFRVLKPGGYFLGKTPNKYHYMPLIARITPHWFHQFVNKLRGRETVDTFPTRYRINEPKSVTSYAIRNGFKVREIQRIEGRPEYLRMSAPSYLLGWLYERAVNSSKVFAHFRVLLVCVLEKPL
jgi:ubiquinone/menaquinone biosynthesis C-methylase UbiE